MLQQQVTSICDNFYKSPGPDSWISSVPDTCVHVLQVDFQVQKKIPEMEIFGLKDTTNEQELN